MHKGDAKCVQLFYQKIGRPQTTDSKVTGYNDVYWLRVGSNGELL
jgi:hypothetical protein